MTDKEREMLRACYEMLLQINASLPKKRVQKVVPANIDQVELTEEDLARARQRIDRIDQRRKKSAA